MIFITLYVNQHLPSYPVCWATSINRLLAFSAATYSNHVFRAETSDFIEKALLSICNKTHHPLNWRRAVDEATELVSDMARDSHLVHYRTNIQNHGIYIYIYKYMNLYTYSYTGMPHSFPWCFCSGVIVCTAFQYSSLDYPHNRYVISHLHTRLERSLSMFWILPKIFFFFVIFL